MEEFEYCSKCKFFKSGECRRFPPNQVNAFVRGWGKIADFPCVRIDSWCGEYKTIRNPSKRP